MSCIDPRIVRSHLVSPLLTQRLLMPTATRRQAPWWASGMHSVTFAAGLGTVDKSTDVAMSGRPNPEPHMDDDYSVHDGPTRMWTSSHRVSKDESLLQSPLIVSRMRVHGERSSVTLTSVRS